MLSGKWREYHRNQCALANRAQLALTGIAHDREAFSFGEDFSCVRREFLTSGKKHS
jgi:hypothetical protein